MRDRDRELLVIVDTCSSLADAGRKLGISREWVRKLADELGVNRWRREPPTIKTCPICQKVFKARHWKSYIQQTCSFECGHKLRSQNIWHSPLVERICSTCGGKFMLKVRKLRRERGNFCSHKCWGSFVGKHYGFGKEI